MWILAAGAAVILVAAVLLAARFAAPASEIEAAAPGARLAAVDLAAEVGLAHRSATYSLTPADTDGDGATDLVMISGHARGGQLYELAPGGTFRAGFRIPFGGGQRAIDRHGCALADFDAKGGLDVACAAGRTRANWVKGPDVDNELWLRQADGSFVEAGTRWGIGDPYGRGRAQYALDANGDGWPDLYTANELPWDDDAESSRLGANKLYLNAPDGRGGRRMVPSPRSGLDLHLGQGRCGEVLDWDGNGWQDLFLCAASGGRLFLNQGGSFRDATAEVALARDDRYVDADLVDLDGDGRLDLVGVRGDEVVWRRNEGGALGAEVRLRRIRGGALWSVAPGDYDGDGRTDLYLLRSRVEGPSERLNPDDEILLQGAAGDFSATVAVPPATGRGIDAEAIRLPGRRCDLAVVLNWYTYTPGPTQVIGLQAPGCGRAWTR